MWFQKSANLQQFSYLSIFILGGIAVLGLQNNRLQKVATQIKNPDYLQREQKLQTALNLRTLIPPFGFDNLVADGIYLEFVQYFGDETARKATGYSLVTEYFTAIAELDPQFTEAYVTLATANSMYAGKADKTVVVIDKLLQSTPAKTKGSHLMWTLKAIDETIFLGDTKAARFSYQKAAEFALQQNNQDSVSIASLNYKKAQFLATKPDTTEAQITAWKSVLPHVVKDNEKQVIRDRIQALEMKSQVKIHH